MRRVVRYEHDGSVTVIADAYGSKRLNSPNDFMIDGVKCGPDGIRCDVRGNVWCASNAGRAVGHSGVTVWNPDGKLFGRIRLPEVCGNIAFGGPKGNRLFMVASQSLYAVYVNTQGATPASMACEAGRRALIF